MTSRRLSWRTGLPEGGEGRREGNGEREGKREESRIIECLRFIAKSLHCFLHPGHVNQSLGVNGSCRFLEDSETANVGVRESVIQAVRNVCSCIEVRLSTEVML